AAAAPPAISGSRSARRDDAAWLDHAGCRHAGNACDRGAGAAHAGMGGQTEGDRASADRCRETVGRSAAECRRSAKVKFALITLLVATAAFADNSATPPKLP